MRSPAILATTKKRWALKRAEAGAAAKAEPIDESSSEKGIEVYEAPGETGGDCRFLPAKLWAYNLYHEPQDCGVLRIDRHDSANRSAGVGLHP